VLLLLLMLVIVIVIEINLATNTQPAYAEASNSYLRASIFELRS